MPEETGIEYVNLQVNNGDGILEIYKKIRVVYWKNETAQKNAGSTIILSKSADLSESIPEGYVLAGLEAVEKTNIKYRGASYAHDINDITRLDLKTATAGISAGATTLPSTITVSVLENTSGGSSKYAERTLTFLCIPAGCFTVEPT